MELLQKAINIISTLSKESWAIFSNGWKHLSTLKDYFLARAHTVYFKWQSKSISLKSSMAGAIDKVQRSAYY